MKWSLILWIIKNIVYCELLYEPFENGEFDEKIESSSVKIQEAENYIKEDEGDVGEIDEELSTWG